jgi:hypothetical protein
MDEILAELWRSYLDEPVPDLFSDLLSGLDDPAS